MDKALIRWLQRQLKYANERKFKEIFCSKPWWFDAGRRYANQTTLDYIHKRNKKSKGVK